MRIRKNQIGTAVLLVGVMLAGTFALAQSDVPTDNGEPEQTTNNGSSKDNWDWSPQTVSALSTVFVAAFTGVLLIFAIVNVRHTKIIQRAYIAVDPAAVRALKEPEDYAMAVINIRNLGNLPARNVKWVIKSKFSNDMRLKEFPVSRDEAEGDNTLPSGSAMLQGSNAFEAGDMKAAIRGLYVYIWGAVFYEDGFSKERNTRFCHRYHCVNFKGTRIHSEVARFHRYGNEAD